MHLIVSSKPTFSLFDEISSSGLDRIKVIENGLHLLFIDLLEGRDLEGALRTAPSSFLIHHAKASNGSLPDYRMNLSSHEKQFLLLVSHPYWSL